MKGLSDWLQVLSAANLFGADETKETIYYNAHTQWLVPLLQFLTLIPLGLLGAFAAWQIVIPLGLLLDRATGVWDLLLLSMALTAGAWVAGWLVELLLNVADLDLTSRAWFPIARALTAIGLVVLGLGVLQMVRQELTRGETLRMAFGLALLWPTVLLFERFRQELHNPKYPRTPALDLLDRLIRLWSGQQEAKVIEVEPYPVHTYGGQRPTAGVHAPQQQALPEPKKPEIRLGTTDLIGFLKLARRHGLGRDDTETSKGLLTSPHWGLPSGLRLTRGRYDYLMRRAASWDLVEKDDTGAWCWKVEPDEAIRFMENVERNVLEELQRGE